MYALCVMKTLRTGQQSLLPGLSSAFQRYLNIAQSVQSDQPRKVKIQNGEKVQRTFSSGEMNRRQDMIRQHMETAGLDACVFTSYHNVFYFSDFLYCKFGRNYAYIITPEKSITVASCIDYGRPWRRAFGDKILYTDWQKDNFFYVVKQELGDAKHIGIEFDVMPLDEYAKFSDAFSNAKFKDVGESTMRMRMIKSSEEIEIIRQGARIADLGGEAVKKVIREGVGEHEVALAGTDAMVREIAKTYPHLDLRDTWVWFQSGVNTDSGHNPVTSRRIKKGDILSLNCFPMIEGYYAALERTLFLDHVPSDRHMELWEANCKVHRRGLELIKPGAKCRDIAEELNDMYRDYGLLKYRIFGYGHSFGVLSHYYGREAALEIREHVDTVLQPNMVMAMEPHITIPVGESGAGAYREHDMLVIKEDGTTENITAFPFGPEHNVVKT